MVRVVCDSSNSLPDDVLARLNIIEVPALVNVTTPQGVKAYRNKIELPIDEFYRILTTSDKLPTTSQPSPQDFADAFATVDPAAQILCVTVSSALSGTFASATAARDLMHDRQVTVWDAKGASVDSGWQVIAAAEMAQQGASLDEIINKLPVVRANTRTYFTAETLKYLAASGRVPRLRASIGNLLNVKPIIEFQHSGTIEPVGQVRGRKRSLDEMISRAQAAYGNQPVRVGIANANCREEAERFSVEVRGRLHAVEVMITEIGPVLAALAGPGAMGLAVYGI